MGQSLIAGDLAALIAHKRAASLRRGSSMSTRSINRVSGRSEHVRSHRFACPTCYESTKRPCRLRMPCPSLYCPDVQMTDQLQFL